MSLPRLTRALRAFADVSPKFDHTVEENDDLTVKRKCQIERQLKDVISWQHLTVLIHSEVSTETDACSAKLQQLLNVAREIGK